LNPKLGYYQQWKLGCRRGASDKFAGIKPLDKQLPVNLESPHGESDGFIEKSRSRNDERR
jgi:hypothetical protein